MSPAQGSSEMFCDADGVVLGLGGDGPGVVTVTNEGGVCQRLADLPAGQSVYAIDVHISTNRVAYGTRAGSVHVTSWLGGKQDDQTALNWSQPAPILAVCWVQDGLLAVADTARRCLLWNTVDLNHPEQLETEGRIICSLCLPPNGELAGLSEDGDLLFWSVSEGRLLRRVRGAAPPPKLALVHLRFWERGKVLLYPAADGRLCLLSPDAFELQYVDAHQGLFYVVVPGPEGVLTIGQDQRRIRGWGHLPGRPCWEATVPWSRPIVGGWPIGAQGRSLLLVDREGTAAYFECVEGTVRLVRRLAGSNYRTVAGLPGEEIERRRDTHRTARGAGLQRQAQEEIGRHRAEAITSLADEMAALGFERMALGVRAQQARLQNRPLDELRIRRQLMDLLGSESAAQESVRQYVLLLQMLWLLPEAWSLCRAHPGASDRDEWLRRAAATMAQGEFVVEPDTPLPLIVGAATLLDRPLSGTWVITSSEPQNLPPRCSLEAFLEKYEQIRTSNAGPEAVPPAACQTVWWLTRGLVEQVTLVDLTSSSETAAARLRSALRYEAGDGLGRLKPVLLLEGNGASADSSAAVFNDELLSVVNVAGTAATVSAQQWEVQRLVTEALRRLRTESLWQRNQGKEPDHER